MAMTNGKLDRGALERMKRVDIQKMCKDYGVRANMKTEALIELLLDTVNNSNLAPLHRPPPPRPTNAPVTRRLSARSRTASQATTIRTRGSSSRSIIVHGDERPSNMSFTTTAVQSTSARARKARESQSTLGVGRPTAAGSSSSGVRNITRTLRTRASRSSRLAEDAIIEEQESQTTVMMASTQLQSSQTAVASYPSSNIQPDSNTPNIISRLDALESLIRNSGLPNISQAMNDVHQQLAGLKQAYQERDNIIHHLQTELTDQRNEIALLRSQTGKLIQLEEQMTTLFGGNQPGQSSQPYLGPPAVISAGNKGKSPATRRVSVPLGNSDTNTIVPVQVASTSSMAAPTSVPITSQPIPTVTSLGKRPRESTTSNITGVIEERERANVSETDLARQVLRPNKKRARLNDGGEPPAPSQDSNDAPSTLPTPSMVPSDIESTPAPSGSSTTSGGSRIPSAGTPPPMAHLPEYFTESIDDQLLNRKDPLAGLNPADFNLSAEAANFTAAYGTDGFFPFTFMPGAATSTPRVDGMGGAELFDPDMEPFSPGSALRAQQEATGAAPSFNPFGTRRIPSRTVPVPRTPTQGPNRIDTRIESNAQMNHAAAAAAAALLLSSPIAGMEDDMFNTDRLAFDFRDPATPQYQHNPAFVTDNVIGGGGGGMMGMGNTPAQNHQARQQQQHQSQQGGYATSTGMGAGTSAGAGAMSLGTRFIPMVAATPMRPMTKTLYGTEILDDKRFGDFGREGIVVGSTTTTTAATATAGGSTAWLSRVFQ